MLSQFWQKTNFIKTKSRYCISLNECIVDMIYNIASNTYRGYYTVHGAKILFTSGEHTFRLEQANREHINPRGKHSQAFFKRYIFSCLH